MLQEEIKYMIYLNKTKRLVKITGCVLMSLLPFANTVQAAGVKVTPMVIMTETKQGQAKGVITLTNQSRHRARFRLYSVPFNYGKGGLKVIKSKSSDLSPYLIFSPRMVVIPPGQRRRVRILARILPSMKQQEYRSVIFAEPIKKNSTSGLSLNSRVGVTLYVRHGKLSFNLKAKGAIYDPKLREIVLLINNRGKATVRPAIRWQLTKRRKTLQTGEFSAITILAQGVRKIPIRIFNKGHKNISGYVRLKGELLWGPDNAPKSLPFNFKVYVPSSHSKRRY